MKSVKSYSTSSHSLEGTEGSKQYAVQPDLVYQPTPLEESRKEKVDPEGTHSHTSREDMIGGGRRGKPSASSGEYYELCPGRFGMERGFGEDYGGEAANEGERIHQWLSDPRSIKLQDSELSLAREMESERIGLMELVFPGWKESPPTVSAGEERIWARNNRFSGRPDFLAIRDGHALLIDYKCGRIAVTEAANNGQLRWYVALVAKQYSFESISVAIIQPRCGPLSLHTYNKVGIKRCCDRVNRALNRMEKPNPKLRAGEAQCRYCKAISICPEVEKKQMAVQSMADISALTPAQLGSVLDIIPAIERKCEALRERAKMLLQFDDAAIPGWQLCENSSRRYISNPEKACERALEHKLMTAREFLNCCSASVGKLVSMVEAKQGKGPAEASRTLATIFGEHMGSKQGEPILRKAKK